MKHLFPIILTLFISINAYSQYHREKVKELKIPFISERLNLSEEEAEKFWPVYNAYEETTSKIKHEIIRKTHREIKESVSNISDKKSQELLDRLTKAENNLHDENVKLISKLKKIISPKKIILLRVAEEEFNKRLFDRYLKKKLDSK